MKSIIPIADLSAPDVPSWLIIAIILALLYGGAREFRSGDGDHSDVSTKRKRRWVIITLVVLLMALVIGFVAWQKLSG